MYGENSHLTTLLILKGTKSSGKDFNHVQFHIFEKYEFDIKTPSYFNADE